MPRLKPVQLRIYQASEELDNTPSRVQDVLTLLAQGLLLGLTKEPSPNSRMSSPNPKGSTP